MKRLARYALLVAALLAPALAPAQAQERAALSQAELDQMLAPVALYPDPLLSQMLMAATYPLEVVEAARWSKAHPGLEGDAAVKAAANEGWDPSVTSLVAFPQVLAWMDENLKWTSAVGDAFLAQQPQVMQTVQNLRARAQAAGNLRSDERVVVTQEGPTIAMIPADPQVVYVPYYDPVVVYGTWWWPAYPPVAWRPWPGYVVRTGRAVVWTPGVRVTANFFFGGFDWQQRHASVVRVSNYYNSTVTVNRQVTVNRAPGVWQHDPGHRRGIGYRDAGVQRRYAVPAASTAPRQSLGAPQVETGRVHAPPAQREFRGERREQNAPPESRQGLPPPVPGASPPGAAPPMQYRRDSGASLNRRGPQREQARAADHRPRSEPRRELEARSMARPPQVPAFRASEHNRARPAEAERRRHGEKRQA